MNTKPHTSDEISAQRELAKEYIRLTGHVSLQIIQILCSQDLEIEQFRERLERQRKDLEVARAATADAPLNDLERVGRQQYKLEATRLALKMFENSSNILAGSILQIVQQGMSTVHGSIKTYPHKGRDVSGAALSDVVWQGRNQAMHYETTATRADWRATFATLNSKFPDTFSLARPYVSHAKAIFDLLGWAIYSNYERDIKSLLSGFQGIED